MTEGAPTPPRSRPAARRRTVAAALTLLPLLAAGYLPFTGPPLAAQAAPFKVVVNASNPVTAVRREELSRIFLKRVGTWEHGVPMLPVDLTVDSSVRESFSRVVHGRGAAAIRNRWQQQIYSGRGVPPPERGSEREVVDFVEANPGAIGYLAASTPSNEVKVIELTD